jgi:hypothetical protein
LAAYCAYLGFSAFRHFRTLKPHIDSAKAAATTPHDRGQVAGYQLRHVFPVVAWPLAALGLLTGNNLIRAILVITFAWSIRAEFRNYALGVATGRKATHLAAAPEYVAGRVQPQRTDYAVATLYYGVTCLLPIVGLLYAIWRL